MNWIRCAEPYTTLAWVSSWSLHSICAGTRRSRIPGDNSPDLARGDTRLLGCRRTQSLVAGPLSRISAGRTNGTDPCHWCHWSMVASGHSPPSPRPAHSTHPQPKGSYASPRPSPPSSLPTSHPTSIPWISRPSPVTPARLRPFECPLDFPSPRPSSPIPLPSPSRYVRLTKHDRGKLLPSPLDQSQFHHPRRSLRGGHGPERADLHE